MKNALVILAGGKGQRFGQKIPKQFYKIANTTIINSFLNNLDSSHFHIIILSIEKKYRKELKTKSYKIFKKNKIIFSQPGDTRQKSSYNSLLKLNNFKIQNVLIHDAARPFCTNKLIKKILNSLKKTNCCIPFINYSDRKKIKTKKNNFDKDTLIYNIQTPQGFNYKSILKAHQKFKNFDLADDASLIEKSGLKIKMIKGEKSNIKITYKEDLIFMNLFRKPIFRSGIGFDIHQIDKKTNKGLKLCGIKLPFSKLIGHSDADVGLHAICDSIFGALSMRDIGYHFPNTEKKWKNADSAKFINFCKEELLKKRYKILNLDLNIIAEKPKIAKYVSSMKKRISTLLGIKTNIISIKATTNEKIGFIGNGEGIAAEAIVQITNDKFY